MNSIMECPIAPPGGWGGQKPPSGVGIDFSHPAANNLVGAWLFNEGAGQVVRDYSAQRHDAVASGTVSWIAGPLGMGMRLNGSLGYLTVVDDGFGSCFASQVSTIIARTQSSSSTDKPIFSYDFTSHVQPYYARHLRTVASQAYAMWNNGSTFSSLMLWNATPTTRPFWISSVVTSGLQKLRIDNRANTAASTNSDTITYYHQPVWIGKANYPTSSVVDFYDLFVWNRALSQDEITCFTARPYDMFAAGDSPALGVSSRRRRLLCGAA